ncbi:MAG: enoyl-CoA hydratase/isomerase family protein [Peptococcaceae bacterium]|jgi:enoyl-CoA hydratase|nr:enoyl-CoA hydratase/isomerase family protein [Peptococcaceae bacterium]
MSYRDNRYETMKLEFQGPVAVVRFDRPEAMNAANIPMSLERLEIYRGLAADPAVKAVVVTGNEKAYCAGGDLAAFSQFDPPAALEFGRRGIEYQKVLMDMPKPTIAAVAGYAFGGGMENVLLCDLRIAAENAKFALPEINVGIFPGGGGTQRLPQNISLCQAKEMIFLGKPVDARQALALGLINKVVPLAELLEAAMAWALELCQKAPLSLAAAKKMVNAAWRQDLYAGMEREVDAWAGLYATDDQKEGMRAFLEKRPPSFQGR